MWFASIPSTAAEPKFGSEPETVCFLPVPVRASFEPVLSTPQSWVAGFGAPWTGIQQVPFGSAYPRFPDTSVWTGLRHGNGQVSSIGKAPISCDLLFGRCTDMFDTGFVPRLSDGFPVSRFTASVHDYRTGCVYDLNPDLRMTAASVMKAQILAGVLLLKQETGQGFSDRERDNVALMMHHSHNYPPASALYSSVGGVHGREKLDTRFGLADTVHSVRYGASVTSAADRTRLVGQMLVGGGPLDFRSMVAAWDWMSGVNIIQSWGVSAGLPAGYEAALKNGFYPARGGGWRAATTGVVRTPFGGAYALTVLTDRNASETVGIELVETIVSHVNAALTAGVPVTRQVDTVTCVSAVRGWSWNNAADRLGYDNPGLLRRLNGGESAPLSGQRICRL